MKYCVLGKGQCYEIGLYFGKGQSYEIGLSWERTMLGDSIVS